MSLKELRASLRQARARVRHHTLRARANKQLAARRRRQIRALTTGPAAAVRWALAQVGTPEKPPGSNWGPKISDWIKASGYGFAVPWCQCFVNAAAVKGGAAQLRTGYTPTVLAGIGGYKPVPVSQARPGDFIFFKFPGVSGARCDHVGMLVELGASTVKCVEGNTSPGTSGSQNNGGGVYLKTRPRSLVVGAVRPPYRKG